MIVFKFQKMGNHCELQTQCHFSLSSTFYMHTIKKIGLKVVVHDKKVGLWIQRFEKCKPQCSHSHDDGDIFECMATALRYFLLIRFDSVYNVFA